MPPTDPRTQRWLVSAWVCLVLLAALTAYFARHSVVRCEMVVSRVPEPDGWRGWSLANHELYPDEDDWAMCPNSRPPWLAGFVEVGGASDTWFRRRGDVFVAAKVIRIEPGSWAVPAGHEEGTSDPGHASLYGPPPLERFLFAFRREVGSHFAVAWDPATAALLLGLASMAVALALAATYRRLRQHRRHAPAEVRTLAAPYRGEPPERAARIDDQPPDSIAPIRESRAVRPIRVALIAAATLSCIAIVEIIVTSAIVAADSRNSPFAQ